MWDLLSLLLISNILLDVTPCFGEKFCFHLQGRRVCQEIIKKQTEPPWWLLIELGLLLDNEFGSNTFHRNVGEPLLDYTAFHPRRQAFWYDSALEKHKQLSEIQENEFCFYRELLLCNPFEVIAHSPVPCREMRLVCAPLCSLREARGTHKGTWRNMNK